LEWGDHTHASTEGGEQKHWRRPDGHGDGFRFGSAPC
jgi:hypothetical protein